MSQELISRSQDLKRLREEGYAIEIREGHLLVHEIPYVTANRNIKYGILVSDLTSVAGDITVGPISNHVAYFIGELPCNSDGTPIDAIHNNSNPNQRLGKTIDINHVFSSKPKPPAQYADYYEKMVTYITVIVSQAEAIDSNVTAKPFTTIDTDEEQTVFNYGDTNSIKSKISSVSSKLEGQNVAIIGLGGTGSYILDLVAKTPVEEIHLFDGDMFMQHNAFRSPGAPSIEKLREMRTKVDYFSEIYSEMRKNIHSHSYHITAANIDELARMKFVFLCIDKGEAKKVIVEHLVARHIPFIDVGLGVLLVDDFLIGQARITTSTTNKTDHLMDRISFSDAAGINDYSTNIQIADLNALNAALAVIKWKKLFNFYQDLGREFNTVYSINDGLLINEDYIDHS